MILAPILGTLADRRGAKKRLLALFAFLGVSMTALLYVLAARSWQLALLVYVLGLIGFSGGNVLYDALLLDAAPKGQLDRVSALGFSLGYLGGGILFAVNVVMVLYPSWFALRDSQGAVQLAFLMVAAWWALFSIPVFLFVPESRQLAGERPGRGIREVFRELLETLRHIRRYRQAFLFLLAYWLYIDGVDTVVRMAVD